MLHKAEVWCRFPVQWLHLAVATAHRSFKIARPLSLIQTGDILEFRYIMLKQKGSFIAYNKSR